MTRLYRLECEHGYYCKIKTTYATDGASEQVLLDYKTRFPVHSWRLAECENSEFHLDRGGPCIATVPLVKVAHQGFELSFYVDQCDFVERMLATVEARGLTPYVKIHGAFTCCAIPRELRDGLLSQVRGNMTTYEKQDDEHFAEWEKKYRAAP